MSIIYQPKGKAKEYSPLSANLYSGCNHGCKYCYAPSATFKEREFFYNNVSQRKNVISLLEKDCVKYKNCKNQVLLSFTHDPYNVLEKTEFLTKKSLELFLKYKIPVAILTKSDLILRDIDLIKQFNEHIQVGATLTFDNDKDSLDWEPQASLPIQRLKFLETFHKSGVKTWASFEPVICPEQSLNLIKKSLEFVDVYKIGKINNYNGIDKTIDWTDFLNKVVVLLRENNKPFYIKHDLRVSAPSIKLFGNEVLPDEFCSKEF